MITANKNQIPPKNTKQKTQANAKAQTEQTKTTTPHPAPTPKPPAAPAKMTGAELALNPEDPREREMLFAERKFAFSQRRASALMTAEMIPKDYKANLGNCMIAIDIADRIGCGEIEVMQNLDVIHGRPAWRAKWLIGRINASGLLNGRLQFVFVEGAEKSVHYKLTYYENSVKKFNEGDQKIKDMVCYAIGRLKNGQELIGPKISLELAVLEGWYNKPGSKWATMPEKMFMYRAAAWWADIHMPEAGLGFMTAEEAGEATFNERDVTPARGFQTAQELLDEHQRRKDTRDAIAGKSADPAEPELDTREEFLNALTEEEVQLEIERANDEDSLNLAGDLIRNVIGEDAQKRLGDLFDQCVEKILGNGKSGGDGHAGS